MPVVLVWDSRLSGGPQAMRGKMGNGTGAMTLVEFPYLGVRHQRATGAVFRFIEPWDTHWPRRL